MRLTPASSAACAKVVKDRGACCARGSPASVNVKSGPKNAVRTTSAAPLNVLWPETWAGNGGVVRMGVQARSAVASGLPSASAWRMAVTGRQRLVAYFASQAAIPASHRAEFSAAYRAALVRRLLFAWRVTSYGGRRGEL